MSTRRYASLSLSLVALTLAGCGGSNKPVLGVGSNVVVTAPQTVATSSSAPAEDGELNEPSEPLHYVGTVTLTGPGTKVTEEVKLSTIGYGESGAPPQEVLEASDSDYTTMIATSAYVYGNLKLSYMEGRVPINFGFGDVFGNLSGGFPPGADAVFDINGQWTIGGNEDESALLMNPNESIEIPVWIEIGGAVSNTQTSIPQKDLNLVTWELVPYIEQTGSPSAYSGPQAADCSGKHVLLPFAKLPFSHAGNEYSMVNDESVHCEGLG